MPKVAQDTLDEFGTAVLRARALKGWSLDELSTAMGGTSSRSYLSNVEKGKRSLSPPTVGKLIGALQLDESWIDRFIGNDVAPESEETQQDKETERLIRLKAKDASAPDTSEDLLILLANTHAEGQYADTFTAYTALKGALEAAERIRQRGEMPDNTGGQLQAVMAEVARLNSVGDVDQADALLEAEEKRQRAEEKAIKERLDEQARQLLDRRLDQDRLRNDPKSAADRLIRDMMRRAPPGGVVRATRDTLNEWRREGDRRGDMFALRVALVLANRNLTRAKGALKGFALNDLGNCRLAIGERRSDTALLHGAVEAFRTALKTSSKTRDPQNWAADQNNLGNALSSIGERENDADALTDSVAAHRAGLTVRSEATSPEDWANSQNNLGTALQAIGEMTRDVATMHEALAAQTAALRVRSRDKTPGDWAMSQNNLGVCLRWLGTLESDPARFSDAEAAYARCLEVWTREKEPFLWAKTQWNLGDLALARFDLTPDPALLDTAEAHVHAAREVFADGSDHQTERCDELLIKIATARAGLENGQG